MRDAARRIIRRVGVETGGSNIQFATQPRRRPHGRGRDEPARVAQLGAGVEGHRVSDCQDRREAGPRLSPRRDSQRHHAADAGLVRADDRLRRGEDPALELREVPPGRPHAHDADEVGGRGDVDWPHFQRGVPEGRAVARARQGGPAVRARRANRRAARSSDARRGGVGAAPPARRADRPAHVGGLRSARARLEHRADPRAHQDRSVVPGAVRRSGGAAAHRRDGGPARHVARPDAHVEARRVRRPRARAHPAGRRFGRAREAARAGAAPVFKRIDTCAAEFESFTPYLYSTYETDCEAAPDPGAQGAHSRQRSEPHRAGHRVRLLLLSCRLRLPPRRLRNRDGELQPGDRVDRLRHGRPAVFRAAHVRRRDGGDRPRAARATPTSRWSCSSAARPR